MLPAAGQAQRCLCTGGGGALLRLLGKAEVWEEAQKNIKHLLAFLQVSSLGGGNKTEIEGVHVWEDEPVCSTGAVSWHFASPEA